MSFYTIKALVLRYLYLYTRTPVRIVELIFWPLVHLLVWGYLTRFLQQNVGDDFPHEITFLIGAVILWDILFRAQQGVAIFFLEDVWSRNLLNIFAAPVTNADYLGSTYAVGMMRAGVTSVMLGGLSALLYSFNVFQLSWALIPFVFNLLIFGWALGMISTALIVRWGAGRRNAGLGGAVFHSALCGRLLPGRLSADRPAMGGEAAAVFLRV